MKNKLLLTLTVILLILGVVFCFLSIKCNGTLFIILTAVFPSLSAISELIRGHLSQKSLDDKITKRTSWEEF
jgi:hypothetical protein